MNATDFALVEHMGTAVKEAPAHLPTLVKVQLRAPEFMQVAFVLRYGPFEWFILAFADAESADAILRNGHPGVGNGAPLLSNPRFHRAEVVGGKRKRVWEGA